MVYECCHLFQWVWFYISTDILISLYVCDWWCVCIWRSLHTHRQFFCCLSLFVSVQYVNFKCINSCVWQCVLHLSHRHAGKWDDEWLHLTLYTMHHPTWFLSRWIRFYVLFPMAYTAGRSDACCIPLDVVHTSAPVQYTGNAQNCTNGSQPKTNLHRVQFWT
jgi:hypothetical protein